MIRVTAQAKNDLITKKRSLDQKDCMNQEICTLNNFLRSASSYYKSSHIFDSRHTGMTAELARKIVQELVSDGYAVKLELMRLEPLLAHLEVTIPANLNGSGHWMRLNVVKGFDSTSDEDLDFFRVPPLVSTVDAPVDGPDCAGTAGGIDSALECVLMGR